MDPFTGHWTLNLAASRFTVPAPAEWTQDLEVYAEGLRAYERIVGATGAESQHAVEARFDGSEAVVMGSPLVDTIAYTRPAPTRIDGVARKSGAVVFRETITVSADGETLTTALVMLRSDGSPVESVAVFTRASEHP
jgi:hypothetical protein